VVCSLRCSYVGPPKLYCFMPEDGSRNRFRIVVFFKAVDEMRYTKTNAPSSDTIAGKTDISVLRVLNSTVDVVCWY